MAWVRLVVQRVRQASVAVGGETVSSIAAGLLVLVGFGAADGPDFAAGKACRGLLEKLLDLRIFPDEAGKLKASMLSGAQIAVLQIDL